MKVLVVVALEQELSGQANQLLTQAGVDIVYSGVGKVNAALTTLTAIRFYSPDMIVNYGTAGSIRGATGFKEVTKVCQRDMLPADLGPRGITPFSKDTSLYLTNSRPGLRLGTGDSFVTDTDPWLVDHCDLVDMEGYAIARAANIHGIPWRIYKHVSDHANGDSAESWKTNVETGSDLFASLVLELSDNRHYNS